MKVFIFERIEQCSNNYHSEGGVVVIASDIEAAKELMTADGSVFATDEEWSKVESYDLAGDVAPKLWTMPDAGCC